MRKFRTVVAPLLGGIVVCIALLSERSPRVTYAPDTATRQARSVRVEQPVRAERSAPSAQYDAQVVRAFQNRRSNVQVHGAAPVSRILSDDNEGSRHQRFILRLSSGKTLLIAHNIDLAPRIHGVREGDWIEFYGEYEWNDKGGVVHWTHHDPGGRHVGGWLRHNGNTYQ